MWFWRRFLRKTCMFSGARKMKLLLMMMSSKFREPVRIDGSFKGRPPVGIGLAVFGLGFLAACMTNGVHTGFYESWTSWIPRIFVFGVGGVFMGAGVGFLWVSHAMKRCVPAAELGARYSAEPDAVTDLAKEKGVQPRFIINGQSWYNPEDLGDAMTLLRPASSEGGNSLLRPAGASSNPHEQLLRPASSELGHMEIPSQTAGQTDHKASDETTLNVSVGGQDRHE
jgi:hypothetical protein